MLEAQQMPRAMTYNMTDFRCQLPVRYHSQGERVSAFCWARMSLSKSNRLGDLSQLTGAPVRWVECLGRTVAVQLPDEVKAVAAQALAGNQDGPRVVQLCQAAEVLLHMRTKSSHRLCTAVVQLATSAMLHALMQQALHVSRTSLSPRKTSLAVLSGGHVPVAQVRGSSSSTAPARGAPHRPGSVGDTWTNIVCTVASSSCCSAHSKGSERRA